MWGSDVRTVRSEAALMFQSFLDCSYAARYEREPAGQIDVRTIRSEAALMPRARSIM